MQTQDSRYDSYYHYIWYQDSGAWSTRFTVWYVAGLLYRAQGDDIANGIATIESVLVLPFCICSNRQRCP